MLLIPVSETLRERCPRTVRPVAPTIEDLATFSIEQEADLSKCEVRKDEAVGSIDAYNAKAAKLSKELAPKKKRLGIF